MMSVDGSNIVRVSDEKAAKLYHEGFRYVAKSLWKEKVRDVNKEPELNQETGKLELTEKKSNKMSKSQKRHMRKSNK
tara:strand:+ start:149 stop:379 length:231 start_codon:yes stop_codon:yes gene_type:complete